jgi:hypothetical protein
MLASFTFSLSTSFGFTEAMVRKILGSLVPSFCEALGGVDPKCVFRHPPDTAAASCISLLINLSSSLCHGPRSAGHSFRGNPFEDKREEEV